MIDEGAKKIPYKSYANTMDKIKGLKGYLSERAARNALLEYFRANLWIFVNVVFNLKLYQVQVMMLKMMFNRSRLICLLPRGYSKSWTTALFAALYALLNPGTRIGIISPSFRGSREIIKKIEDFGKLKGADLFKDCIGKVSHATDYWSVEIGTSEVIGIPLTQKSRGFRFSLVIADEMLLISNDLIKSVVLPFLSTNVDPYKQQEVKDEETKLIKAGLMKEEDRTQFPGSKFIGLSSASFKFEDFYKTFEEYERRILHPDPSEKEEEALNYGIMQFSHSSAPKGLYQIGFIEDAKAQMSEAHFKREMESVFVDGSGGYFSLEKMLHYSSKFGDEPFVEVIGEKKAEYIIGIDPSFSDADDSDYFAISLLKVDRKNNKAYLVHGFEKAGSKQKDNIEYMAYLLMNFNIVYVIIDNAGWEFIDSCNNSQIFKEYKLNIDKFEFDYENDNKIEGLRFTKRNYNKELGKIVHIQYFSNAWLDLSNTYLQTALNFGRIWFCGAPDDSGRNLMINQARKLPMDKIEFGDLDEFDKGFEQEAKIHEFVDNISFIVARIREECSLIEMTTSSTGTSSYNLPRALKMSKGKNRPRRDGYTSLLLANYAFRCYTDLMDPEIQSSNYSNFLPITF